MMSICKVFKHIIENLNKNINDKRDILEKQLSDGIFNGKIYTYIFFLYIFFCPDKLRSTHFMML